MFGTPSAVMLGDPQVLPVLLPFALALGFAIRPWQPRRAARLVAWLAGTAGALALLVGLAHPVHEGTRVRPQRWALLVDNSASATREDAGRIADFADRMARHLAGAIELDVVPVAPPAEPTGDLRERTSLAPALLALRGYDRAVLASDGRFAEDASSLETLIRRLGVPVDLPAHLPAPRETLRIHRFVIDHHSDDARGARGGDDGRGRWAISLENGTTRPAELVVTAARAGAGEIELGRRPIAPLAGELELGGRLPRLAPGLYHLVARIVSPETSFEAALHAASAVVATGDLPRVLVVAADATADLVRQLAAGPLALDLRTPADVPVDVADLLGYRAVVLAGVPPTSLRSASAHALTQFVVKHGGGLLLADARAALASSAWSASPIAELFPLTPSRPAPPTPDRPKPPPIRPPRPPSRAKPTLVAKPVLALVLIIDCSGSMRHEDKLALAREAAVAALDRLDDRDLIGVVAFNARPEWIVPPTEARARETIALAIRSLRAEGETDIEKALQAANARLAGLDCPIKHVVLVSDGHTGGVAAFKDLVTGMAAGGITVTTVGVGDQFDHQLMSNIARWGKGRFFPATAKEVPRIAVSEAVGASDAARAIRHQAPPDSPENPDPPEPSDPPDPPEQAAPPVPADPPGDRTPVASAIELRSHLRSPVLAGVGPPFPAPGELPGVESRPGATVVLETSDGQPVLALWRQGPGRVAILTPDTSGPASGAWGDWPAVPRMLAQLVEHVLSDPKLDDTSVELNATWSEADAGWNLDAWVRGPDGAPYVGAVALTAIASGRPAAEPNALGPGWWRWTVPASADPSPAWRLACGARAVDVVPPREVLDPDSGRETLRRLCRASEGEEALVPEAMLGEPVRCPGRAPLAPGAPAGLAAALLALSAGAWRLARVRPAERPTSTGRPT